MNCLFCDTDITTSKSQYSHWNFCKQCDVEFVVRDKIERITFNLNQEIWYDLNFYFDPEQRIVLSDNDLNVIEEFSSDISLNQIFDFVKKYDKLRNFQ